MLEALDFDNFGPLILNEDSSVSEISDTEH